MPRSPRLVPATPACSAFRDEVAYIKGRQALIPAALKVYLGDSASAVYGGSLDALGPSNLPVVGLSISGGGDRAALYGASFLATVDGTKSTAVATGMGGLLQISSYISALSGGSWMLSSYVFNNMPQIYDMVLGPSTTTTNSTGGWNLAKDLFVPGEDNATQDAFLGAVYTDIATKANAGFPVTFGDFWARVLSYHFLPGTTADNFYATGEHGNSFKFSSIVDLPVYVNRELPFPIIVGEVYSVNQKAKPLFGAVPVESVIYEMTPLEFGSYDPSLSSFIPMKYFGTPLVNGTSTTGSCVTNFDNAGYVLGISSNLFYLYNTTKNAVWTNTTSSVNVAWNRVNTTFNQGPNVQLDSSVVPNPFAGVGIDYEDSNQSVLRKLDGGLDGEVDAVEPLIVPGRAVDCLVVVDGTADTRMNTPTGASLRATAYRAALPQFAGSLSLPPLPKINTTWIDQGLTVRPAFFGCEGTPAMLNGSKIASPYPFLVFLPNYSPGFTNTSTGQVQYLNNQTTRFLDAAFTSINAGFPLANATTDPNWPTCLKCTTLERTRGRTGVDRTSACNACFSRYCWSGREGSVATVFPTPGANSTIATNSTGTATAAGTVGGNAVPRSGAVGMYVGGMTTVVLGAAIALVV